MIGIADILTCEELLAVLAAVRRHRPTPDEVVEAQTAVFHVREKNLCDDDLARVACLAILKRRTREAKKARRHLALTWSPACAT
jgi:hypothetical protein